MSELNRPKKPRPGPRPVSIADDNVKRPRPGTRPNDSLGVNHRPVAGLNNGPSGGAGAGSIITAAPASIPFVAPQGSNPTTPQENAQVVTDTTTVKTSVSVTERVAGSVLTGVSIIPYMRALAIDFIAYKIRPNRELWFYFDNVGVNKLIQRPNIIEAFNSDIVNDIRSGPQRNLKIGSSVARILHVERNIDTGNAVFYVSEFTSSSAIAQNNAITVEGTSYNSTVMNYHHSSGIVQANTSNNLIFLSNDANGSVDDYYYGNTITIVNGTDAGQSAEIISYNCATRMAYVRPNLKINPKETGLIYTLGDYRTWYSSNTYPSSYSTERGLVSGVFHIPDPNKNPLARFRTGDKIFRIVDNPFFNINHPDFGQGTFTTKAEYRFVSNGLDRSIAQIIESDLDIDVEKPIPSPTPTPTKTPGVTPTNTSTPVSGTPARTGTPTSTPDGTPIATYTPTRTNLPPDTPPPTPPPAGFPVSATRTRTPMRDTPSGTKTPTRTGTPTPTKEPPPVTPTRTPSCQPRHRTQYFGRGEAFYICYSCCPVYTNTGQGGSLQYPGGATGPGLGNPRDYGRSATCKSGDPIAQTFYVPGLEHPEGVFVSSVDLFFKNKGELLPVEVQIRPVVNGVPSENKIIPGATTTVDIEDIKVSNFPNTSNSMTATRFTFPSPVYLNSAYEYAIVVLTDDFGYDYYSAELGGTVLGTDSKISKQPFTGSFFKSQNSRTWTPLQNEDLMFVLNRCEFSDSPGVAIFDEDKTTLLKEISSNVAYNSFDDIKSNTYFDSLELLSDAIELNNTKLNYYFKGTSNTTKILSSSYINFNPDRRFDLEERNVLFNPQLDNKSMTVRVDMTTKNRDVSPIIFHNRQNMVTIENLINDTGLTADRFTITNAGNNYDKDGGYVTITSNVGYGANAWAVADSTTGNIVSIIVDSSGSGYVGDVTATIGGGQGSGATLSVSTETGTSGGPALARYISKTVTLLDGFDAGDLRVFLTAIKPPEANVNVYYKVRNLLDPQKIEDNEWVRMTQKTSEYVYSTNRTPIEYEYRPSLTSNNITYSTDTTTYKTFNQYAIKIVLSSRSTVANAIPYVLDVRAIALPEDAY